MPLVALLDTNVWVSAFLKPAVPPGQVIAKWRRDDFTAVTSLSQLAELAEVLSRPRLFLRFKYPPEEVETTSLLFIDLSLWTTTIPYHH